MIQKKKISVPFGITNRRSRAATHRHTPGQSNAAEQHIYCGGCKNHRRRRRIALTAKPKCKHIKGIKRKIAFIALHKRYK